MSAEKARAKGRTGLAQAMARSLYKLMAYKDEYEVAHLYTDGDFEKKLQAQFEADFKLKFNLAPPLLADRDPVTGELKKGEYGPRVFTMFRVLTKMKRLPGTAFNIFGDSEERRTERRLIGEYMETMGEIVGKLDPSKHVLAVQIAGLPETIRGFGHVKDKNLHKAKEPEAKSARPLSQSRAAAGDGRRITANREPATLGGGGPRRQTRKPTWRRSCRSHRATR